MVYKLLSFILVYILSIVNFVIILSPLLIFIIPIMISQSEYIKSDSTLTIILLMFLIVSLLMILFMIIDFLFGISTRHFLKDTKEYTKLKDYDVLEGVFEDIKLQFNKHNVKLLISSSEEANAFAIGNMGRQYIVITKGLISAYLIQLKDKEYFLSCIKCIMGHEMSHLINKDYLPALLLQMNENATDIVSKIIFTCFNIIINILQLIPFVGGLLASFIITIYNGIDFIISFFYKYIILSIYKFFQLKISRENEYRCDIQSSEANGGEMMAKALSIFGEEGYTTIFSTHPKTSSRIAKVKNIEQSYGIIKPRCGNALINFIFVLFMILVPILIYQFMNIKGLIENYYDIESHIRMQFIFLKIKIQAILNGF